MERYHIFKLGLAIVFYAVYCIRPMLVYGLQTDDPASNSSSNPDDFLVYYQGVEGRPGIDFPVHSFIPRTSFNCKDLETGYYADLETDCQVFHICEEGKKISFLCPNGTIFQQSDLICEWWFKVNCTSSPNLYDESAEQLREDNARRKASRRVNLADNNNHGAIMRMEEKASVSATQNGRHFQVRVDDSTPQPRRDRGGHGRALQHNAKNRQPTQNVVQDKELKPVNNEKYTAQEKVDNVNYNNYNSHSNQQNYYDNYNNENNYEYSTTSAPLASTQRFNEHTPSETNLQSNNPIAQSTTIDLGGVRYTTNDLFAHTEKNFAQSTNSFAYQSTPVPDFGSTTTQISQNYQNYQNYEISSSFPQTTQPPFTQPPFVTSSQKPGNYDVSQDLGFPLHETEANHSKIATKNEISELKTQNKISSTVILTRNDLINRNLHAADSGESQIPQETASFVKNNHNTIKDNYKLTNLYPNHRPTYSDLKNPSLYSTKQVSMISSVTPQYITTQPINNGKPFLGSRVGNFAQTTPKTNRQQKSTIILGVLRSTTTVAPPEIITANPNGNNPDIYVQISGGNPAVRARSRSDSSTARSLAPPTTTSRISTPVSTLEPPFASTTRKVDHATVYGTFAKDARTTPLPTNNNNQGVQIKFDKNSNKVAVQLSKSVLGFSSTSPPEVESRAHFNDVRSTAQSPKSGFYVTKENEVSTTPGYDGFTLGTSSSSYYGSKTDKVRPRPFQLLSQSLESRQPKGFTTEPPTSPSYKISSASPFMINVPEGPNPTLPTRLPSSTESNSVYENVDNMIGVLMEIANVKQNENDYSAETPRPGLIIPPSAGPQTLHTLAQYFANALDGIVTEKQETLQAQSSGSIVDNKERLTALLTQMTRNHYNELFKEDKKKKSKEGKQLSKNEEELETQHSKNLVQTPEIRQLARNFSLALSMYLDNPEMYRNDLKKFRPTEPPPLSHTEDSNDEELLNFSDADSKSSYPPIFPTSASLVPTWGYILAFNNTKPNLDVKNSLNPDLQLADSQSFVPGFNQVNAEEKKKDENRKGKSDLPYNHWTSSPDATKLWQNTFSVNPLHFNEHFHTTQPITTTTTTEETVNYEEISTITPPLPPVREIQYELHSLPKLSLNSTQVHGILIDFMNTTKSDDSNRLQRILRKLNTTEGEFLDRMKEIENNPLTRRLILLLISECGANVTKDFKHQQKKPEKEELQLQQTSNPAIPFSLLNESKLRQTNSNLRKLVDSSLKDDGEDARALQLLNSLYTIASKFGK